ncbi:phospho-acceptor domain-containing protein [Balneicella halophila]|uniref:histidine kinase n=1 Tax=Balneicella halophila TaxID=1537566 RepID=A0A7L4UR57_BALHA|nr:ABC transporter substrate binding protein [Balneicella halophila]PVX52149.1 phospho-acceptor domain-containing protein [Balneicella halophila]
MKRKLAKYVILTFPLFLLNWVLLYGEDFSLKKNVKSILVLHSYHQGMQWTDSITKGIQQVIKSQPEEIDVFFEYLDSKRYLDVNHAGQGQIFNQKYKDRNPFDVIISVDDDALNFLAQNRNSLFANTPIVFCGVNQPLIEKVLRDTLITGVQEIPDIKETFSLIRKLHPNANKIHIVNDIYSETAKTNRKVTDSLKNQYPKEIAYLDTLSSEELKEKVSMIPEDDVILLLTFNQDRNKNFISYKDERRIVLSNASAPVYAVWDFFLGKGVVGGKIIKGKEQGILAAKMSLRVLEGIQPSKIPIVSHSQSSFIFDYRQLKKFGIANTALPTGSIVLEKPNSGYEFNERELFWVIFIFALLLTLVIILIQLVNKNKEAREALLIKQDYLEITLGQNILISKIVTFLNSTNDLSEVVNDVLNTITGSGHADKAFVFSLREENKIDKAIGLRYSENGEIVTDKEKEYWNFNIHRQLRLIFNKKNVVSSNLHEFSHNEQKFFQANGIKSIMLLPIEVRSKVNGVVGFAFASEHNWTPAEMRIFSTLTRVMANAWERNFQMNQYLSIEKQHGVALRLMERTSRLASIGVITGGISHEINQPLNAIKINTSLLLRQLKGEKNPLLKKLKSIDKGINRIDQIILQMRDYWVKPGLVEEDQVWVDLNKALQRSCSLVERNLKKENVRLHTQLAGTHLLIEGNKIQVEQIIINLLMNAIQAVKRTDKKDKIILVKTFKQYKSALLIIEDNGPGIPKEIGEYLFDPFFTTKEKEEGTGLGLAIVKAFVVRMKGHIRYENINGGGVRFVVDFNALEDEKVSITPNF